MMLYISMKFHENNLNGFQVIERTLLRDRRTGRQTYKITIVEFQRENNAKHVWTRYMVLVFCTSSDDTLYFYEVS